MIQATPSSAQSYIGRFAPSPTGPLHLGSLFTALAGFLDAKKHRGLWLLRIDDLDTPRNTQFADQSIKDDLERFGLYWDGAVDYQSHHLAHYEAEFSELLAKQQLYRCICSRKDLQQLSPAASRVYPGLCRDKPIDPSQPHAFRIKTVDTVGNFIDRLQGKIAYNLATTDGDFIVKRRDGIFAYQFAVVVDDRRQHVTNVVRGSDLLDSTPRQLYLQQHLEYAYPTYMHLPVIVDKTGQKLSKQNGAPALDRSNPVKTLYMLLQKLKQNPPPTLSSGSLPHLLDWAIEHWQPAHLEKITSITL